MGRQITNSTNTINNRNINTNFNISNSSNNRNTTRSEWYVCNLCGNLGVIKEAIVLKSKQSYQNTRSYFTIFS